MAQKPTEFVVPPGGMTRFHEKLGDTLTVPVAAEKFPFQVVYVVDAPRFRVTLQLVVG